MLPSPARASNCSASSAISICFCGGDVAQPIGHRLRARWCGTRRPATRDSTVSGIFCGSVVAIMNTTCGGGSSIDFSSALNDDEDSMCTSSMRKTL